MDATGNNISVTISNNRIAVSSTTDAASFTIAKSGSSYSIKSASGYYIGQTSNANGLSANASTAYSNSISYHDGDVDIVSSGGAYLRFNSGDNRFRYYKSGTYAAQQAIQLYKKVGEPVSVAHTITFHNGTETTTQTVNDFEASVLDACTFTRDGYVFAGWNTKADGTGDYYADEATVTLFADLDLYAQWDQLFAVTCLTSSYGTITATPTEATEDTPIILTAQPQPGYQLRSWSVSDAYGNDIPVMENSFDMPASDVQVSASWLPEGDVNDDGKVTIADAVALIAYLLGHPSEPFLEQAADIDGVEGITIGDAVEIVNRILASP